MRKHLLSIGVLCFLLILVSSSGAAELDEYAFERYVSSLLRSIDVTNPGNIYHMQQALMFPVKGAFELHFERSQHLIAQGLGAALDHTKTLADLREKGLAGRIMLDAALTDPSRSGPGRRRIFPLEEAAPGLVPVSGPDASHRIVKEVPLIQLQFCYLISFAMKKASISVSQDKPSPELQRFVQKSFEFLLHDVVLPYWRTCEAPSWAARHKNMKERCLALVYPIRDPALQQKSFYKAVLDADLFFFAIAADLNYVLNTHSAVLQGVTIAEQDREVLGEIRELTVKVVRQRLEPRGFLFQIGVWSDHPDFLYGGYEGEEYPTSPRPDLKISEDSSHSHRWPWWLESYRDSWPASHEHHRYYQTLLERLASQFIEKVAAFPDERRVLLTNYMNGENGWYRVGYSGRAWGFGPYTQTSTALGFSWTILARYDDRIRRYNRILCSVIHSTDPDIIAFRTKFFGDRTAGNPHKNGWRDKDILGEASVYSLYCRIGERLGLY
ncbi:MAG TPA: hypothetical protein VK463_19650 [Desulfomonilaceae bacterium]|nr:hypothetical protein [Desulfomonilaceae bacterium]